jgi:hypothetical protein
MTSISIWESSYICEIWFQIGVYWVNKSIKEMMDINEIEYNTQTFFSMCKYILDELWERNDDRDILEIITDEISSLCVLNLVHDFIIKYKQVCTQ